jgi:hypothetical protein
MNSIVVQMVGVLTCFASMAGAAAVNGRLAGRDVEVSNAVVQGQSDPIPAATLPPNGYLGIELLNSSEKDLFEKFSRVEPTRLLHGSGEVYEGYCYESGGTYVAFNRAASAKFDAVQLSRNRLGAYCKSTTVSLGECIGPYCLGHTRSEIERRLGVKLVVTDDGLEVAYFDYSAHMSAAERELFKQWDLSEVPIKHNLWLKFEGERVSYIGIGRWEDLP